MPSDEPERHEHGTPREGEHEGHTGHESHEGHGGHKGHEGHDHRQHHAMMARDFKRRFWISLVLTVPVVGLSPMIQGLLGLEDVLAFPGDRYVQFVLATAIFFYGGWPFLTGLVSEVGKRQPGMMTLIGLAIFVAYGYSTLVVFGVPGEVFFWELATLIAIMLLGHWIEMRSVLGASGALEALVRLIPDTAHRLDENGQARDVSTSDLGKGDRVLVKPGERVPVDGRIVEGRTSVNEAMVTGESKPVEKGEGDEVIGGAVNGEASITVEVTKTGADTYLSQVVEMVKQAQESKSRSQSLADRAAFWLTCVALGVGAATLGAWLVAGREFVFALERTVTVMVITCPHALGLAVPLVVAVSTALGASKGLLIRNRTAFERARNLQAVVFDKTGTLTLGEFGVKTIVAFGERSEDEVLRLAAAVESHSEHPIAKGIVAEAQSRGIEYPSPKEFKAIPGKGAVATVEGATVRVVSPDYARDQGIEYDAAKVEDLEGKGETLVFVLAGEEAVGAVALADKVRPESREAVEQLKAMGIKPMMLTGDAEAVAKAVAEEVGIEEYFAEVLPDQKTAKIKELCGRGLLVAMTGDGVNDAPALAQADLGIAIGAGTDVAMETADIVLVRSDPRDVVNIVRLARKTHAKMVQNLWWATGYNIVAIPLAAGVFYWAGILLIPAAGALVMSASTVIVAVNARLLKLED